MRVPFGEWLPDLPPLDNPGALVAKNVIPEVTFYRPLHSLSSFSNALTNVCLGAFWLQGSDNTVYNFAGDASDLYLLENNTTWTAVSKAGSYTATNWEMAKFGDRVIAAEKTEPLQYYDVGASALFADLPGSPPNAARIGVVRDFVVLGDLEAFGPNFVGWSGFNSSELWTPSRATQSDRQELFGRGGRVQKIVPGEYGVIVQEHSIHRMDYVGPPVIFQFDEVERGRGTPAANSVVWTGGLMFYYGHDGFYMFDGTKSTPIGANRVNRWMSQNADVSGLDSMRGVVDRRNRLVMWAFKSSASLAFNDRLIIYNWSADKWSYGEVNIEAFFEFVSSGLTLDQLDTPLPAGIDIDSIPVDSDAFKGGALSLQAFNSSHEAGTFSGAALAGEVDTKEIGQENRDRQLVTGVRPLVNGPAADPSVQLLTRERQDANAVANGPYGMNSIGEANMRVSARYHRARVTTMGDYESLQGVEITMKRHGRR